jgi:hypothetical protein
MLEVSEEEQSMSSVTDAPAPKARKAKRNTDPVFVVRAKCGPNSNAWATLGYAWARENGEGFSIKLNALPIGNEWNGVLKLLPPYVAEEDTPNDE